MKKLKIGLFMDDYYPSMNGVIEVMDNYAKRLINLGHEVVVVVPNIDKNYIDDFSYKVIRLPSIKISYIGYNAAIVEMNKILEKKLIKENFDIIHIHSQFIVGTLGVRIAKKLNIPVVGTMHTQIDKDLLKFLKIKLLSKNALKLITRVYNKCDVNFAVNDRTADLYLEYKIKKRPEVLLTGTDMHFIEDNKKTNEEINKEYKLSKKDTIFLFVGRLTIVKNILFLIKSLSILQEKGIKFKMLFVGPFEDEREIKACIKKYNLENSVLFLGKITDRKKLAKLYRRSDLFLFPSLYDTNSLVQKEAASQKTPTVFIKEAVTAELVTDNINGFLSENNEESYANKVIEVLNDKELYDRVSEGSYKDLYISWDDLIGDLENRYYNIIDNYKKPNKKKFFIKKIKK